ncbi:MAG TPA: F0F1 ATP synthase subunit A, partial [Anaeromyxobacteraceae bacterium]
MTSLFAPLALALALAQHTPEPAVHGEEPGAPAGEHGAAAGHEGEHSLPEVMMHHVANGEVLELPGFCEGFHWNCEVNLRE